VVIEGQTSLRPGAKVAVRRPTEAVADDPGGQPPRT